MLAFILAISWPIITYQDPVNPNQYLTWAPEPMAEPFYQSDAARADAAMVANPAMWQRTPTSSTIYDEVAERYPVQEVVPRNQRYTVPMEEQMMMDDYRTKMLGREVGIRGQMLNQQIAQRNLEYDTKIMDQTAAAMQRVGEIDPYSPDFDAQVATLYRELPLAQQNPGFQQMVGRLAQTRNQHVQNQEIRDRTLEEHSLRQVYRGDVQDNAIDTQASQLGANAFKTYQEELEKSGDRQLALALAVTESAQEEAAFKRQQELNAPVTRNDYIAYARRLETLMTNPLTKDRMAMDQLPPEDRYEVDFLQQQMRRFAQQQQNPGTYRPSTPQQQSSSPSTPASTQAPPQTRALPIQSLFPKTSTQTQESGS